MGDDHLAVMNATQLAAQGFDMGIDRALQALSAVLPDGIHDLCPRENAPRPFEQQCQEQIFVTCEI